MSSFVWGFTQLAEAGTELRPRFLTLILVAELQSMAHWPGVGLGMDTAVGNGVGGRHAGWKAPRRRTETPGPPGLEVSQNGEYLISAPAGSGLLWLGSLP